MGILSLVHRSTESVTVIPEIRQGEADLMRRAPRLMYQDGAPAGLVKVLAVA